MKVSPTLVFNTQTLKFQGLTDLGDLTPAHQKHLKGDHALVFMFQPFCGKWVQVLACFLSRSAASGSILHQLVMECIVLLEASGFFVDAVTSDGATWNRNMWQHFGISLENPSCTHVCDPQSKLWFMSDFPHLIKNIRNSIINKKYMMTPDGFVKLDFWKAIIAADSQNSFSLKICPKLKPDHINPKQYQKMNVAMAFQFFSHSVASAMEMLKDVNSDLKDCDGCIVFIKRLDKLMDAMNSRTPLTALRVNSPEEETIKSFLKFLAEWEILAKETNTNFLSESTAYGLKITMMATLGILEFLTKSGYKYLMTSRLNQDSLERFFSMMRNACGSNDHPDSITFLQLFRLLGTYSLVKPPRGSNVSGGEILQTLMSAEDLSGIQGHQTKFNEKLYEILEAGSDIYLHTDSDHIYHQQSSPDCVVAYVAGFVAWRGDKFTNCPMCKACLFVKSVDEDPLHDLIKAREKISLCKPSSELFSLVACIESSVMNVISRGPILVDTLQDILHEIEENEKLPLIGCLEHQADFTQAILKYYIITRMHFLCKRVKENQPKKTQELRKLSKL